MDPVFIRSNILILSYKKKNSSNSKTHVTECCNFVNYYYFLKWKEDGRSKYFVKSTYIFLQFVIDDI